MFPNYKPGMPVGPDLHLHFTNRVEGNEGSESNRLTPAGPPLRFVPVRMTIILKEKNYFEGEKPFVEQPLSMEAPPSPLSSRANPDFLPRSTGQGHVCAFQ